MTAKPGDAIMNFSHSYHIYLHYYQLVLNGKYPKTNCTAKLSSTSVGMGTGMGVGTPTPTQPQSFHSWLLSSHFSCDSWNNLLMLLWEPDHQYRHRPHIEYRRRHHIVHTQWLSLRKPLVCHFAVRLILLPPPTFHPSSTPPLTRQCRYELTSVWYKRINKSWI